jgi:hypothetical protein
MDPKWKSPVFVALLGGLVLLSSPLTQSQSVPASLDDKDSKRIVDEVSRLNHALWTKDLNVFRSIIAKEGLSVSSGDRIVTSSDVSQIEDIIQFGARRIWDEATEPVLVVNSITKLGSEAVLVHACRIQPTLMVGGKSTDIVLVRQKNTWRAASLALIGSCTPRFE